MISKKQKTATQKQRSAARKREEIKAKKAALERDGYRCVYTGETHNLEVHHIIPKSRGGTNELSNLITLTSRIHKQAHGWIQPRLYIDNRFDKPGGKHIGWIFSESRDFSNAEIIQGRV